MTGNAYRLQSPGLSAASVPNLATEAGFAGPAGVVKTDEDTMEKAVLEVNGFQFNSKVGQNLGYWGFLVFLI
jgi:hypothetical protein